MTHVGQTTTYWYTVEIVDWSKPERSSDLTRTPNTIWTSLADGTGVRWTAPCRDRSRWSADAALRRDVPGRPLSSLGGGPVRGTPIGAPGGGGVRGVPPPVGGTDHRGAAVLDGLNGPRCWPAAACASH